MKASNPTSGATPKPLEQRVTDLLSSMTLMEKIGQMNQINGTDGCVSDSLRAAISAGHVGSVINEVDRATLNELQAIAVSGSRLGIPLLIGRDVIHGFKTIMPIPLGQAATWNPVVIEQGAQVAAREAAATGINWTFAPMIDVARDPRWGRIAESLGEDPYLAGVLGSAMVRGFQGDDLAGRHSIAACAKHFAGYGTSESGRDYATTNVPENELRNVYLRPFLAAVETGVTTVMTSFSDIDGIPGTANEFLNRQVLRREWGFEGFVLSDWDSVRQLSIHGLTANDKDAVLEAVTAGVNMEMAGEAYLNNLPALIEEGRIDLAMLNEMVADILRVKFRLGLFEDSWTDDDHPKYGDENAIEVVKKAALQSIVMLKNESRVLPLSLDKLESIAIIGPLADAPYEQLGTWVFDGDPGLSITPLQAIRQMADDQLNVTYVRALETSRSTACEAFERAAMSAAAADIAVLFLGEEAILSGEAHSRADISLPGAQAQLVHQVRAAGTPVVAIIMAGRPLTLTNIIDEVDALLFAWHPGTMGGPAIADLLFGLESPSGKLPVTFPRMVGQIPIYYGHKNTGKPATQATTVHIDDIEVEAQQNSFGMSSYHLDAGHRPLFVFGYGLSYTKFEYRNLSISTDTITHDDSLLVKFDLINVGHMEAEEVAQLYVRDLVGNVTRPVRELKRFRRVRLAPGECRSLEFELCSDDLAFYGRKMQLMVEAGDFHVWVGGSSDTTLRANFRLIDDP